MKSAHPPRFNPHTDPDFAPNAVTCHATPGEPLGRPPSGPKIGWQFASSHAPVHKGSPRPLTGLMRRGFSSLVLATALWPPLALAFKAGVADEPPPPPGLVLDLLQGYRLALRNDMQHQAAQADARIAREAVPRARSQLLPSVGASVLYSRNATDRPNSFLLAPDWETVRYSSSAATLTARQPLFRIQNLVSYRQALLETKGAEAVLENGVQALGMRFADAYFEALLAQDQLALVQSQKESYAEQLLASQSALAAGYGTRTDIDDAQARLDLTAAQELEGKMRIDHALHKLQIVIGEPAGRLARIDPGKMLLNTLSPSTADDLVSRAEQANAELRALRAGVDAAREELAKARAAHWPTLDLVAQYKRAASENDYSIDGRYATTLIGVQMNIPVYAGGLHDSQVRKAIATLDKLMHQYEARRREIGLAIRKEFDRFAEGTIRIRALERAERSAAQAVHSSQRGFQAGMRTRLDILNAQQQHAQTQLDLTHARYQYVLARLNLSSLAASLNEDEIGVINGWLRR